jgi:hypothetical protein
MVNIFQRENIFRRMLSLLFLVSSLSFIDSFSCSGVSNKIQALKFSKSSVDVSWSNRRSAVLYTKLMMGEESPENSDDNDNDMTSIEGEDDTSNLNKNSMSSIETDSFGMVRLVAASILGVGGVVNLAKDASHFNESVTGGYILGSVITLAIDIAFTLAMVGAVYKEWQMKQSKV